VTSSGRKLIGERSLRVAGFARYHSHGGSKSTAGHHLRTRHSKRYAAVSPPKDIMMRSIGPSCWLDRPITVPHVVSDEDDGRLEAV
jgi:hypothetical protein